MGWLPCSRELYVYLKPKDFRMLSDIGKEPDLFADAKVCVSCLVFKLSDVKKAKLYRVCKTVFKIRCGIIFTDIEKCRDVESTYNQKTLLFASLIGNGYFNDFNFVVLLIEWVIQNKVHIMRKSTHF